MSQEQSASPPGLRRSLGWREGAAFTIAAVLGSCVLILPAVTANLAGPASLLAWGLMGVFIIPLAWVLGRLAVKKPHAGGIAAYVGDAFGPRWGRLAGFLYLGTVPIGAPLAALIGAGYMAQLIGAGIRVTIGIAVPILLVAVVLNVVGIEISGRTASVVVLVIAAILLASVLASVPHMSAARFRPWMPHGWVPVGRAMALLFWAFVGWEMLGHMTEEFTHPARDVMVSMGVALVVVDVLYVATAWATIGTGMYGPHRTADSLARLVGLGLGASGRLVVAVLAVLIAYGTTHTYVAGFSRLVYAEARIGHLPRWLAVLHPRYRTPSRILWLMTLPWAVVLAWTFAVGRLPLATLIAWPSAIFIVLYLLAMASAWRLLRQRWDRLMALMGLAISVSALPFLGAVALYPAGLLLIGALLLPRTVTASD